MEITFYLRVLTVIVESWLRFLQMVLLEVCGLIKEKKIKLALKNSSQRISIKTKSIFFLQ
jgi:hypothetical protein